MFTTISANPLLGVQGKYLVIVQEDVKLKVNGRTKKRYVILDSDSLSIRKSFEGENAKDELSKEVLLIEEENTPRAEKSLESLAAAAPETKPLKVK